MMSKEEINRAIIAPSATVTLERNTKQTNVTVSVTGSDISTVQAQAEAAYNNLIMKYPKNNVE